MARLSLRVGGYPFLVIEDDVDDVEWSGGASHAAVFGGNAW